MGLRARDREVTDGDLDRVSSRLLAFVFDLLRHAGEEPPTDELPPWVPWSEYIAAIHHLGEVVGGPAGVAAAMRATLGTAYSDLRGFAGFFSGPIPFFAFVTHQLNVEIVPGAVGRVDMLGPRTLRARYQIHPSLEPSRLYLEGTRTLIEVFPTHFGLAEARVDTVAIGDREAEFVAEFPDGKPKVKWGTQIAPSPTASLTQREQQVLQLVCEGLTNAEIASALGTAASTVKTQISTILSKMNVANRTELAALASRRD